MGKFIQSKLTLSLFHIIYFCLIFVSILICNFEANAMPYKGHAIDVQEILGLDFSSKEGEECLKTISSYVLDDYREFRLSVLEQNKIFRELVENESITFTAGYSHRILFHWGAGGRIPFNSPPLKEYFDTLREKRVPEDEIKKYKDMIIEEWEKRRNRMFKAVKEFLVKVGGLSASDAEALSKPLATLIYDIHLLGDYEGTHINSLPEINQLRKSILKTLNRKIFRSNPKIIEIIERIERVDTSDARLAAREIKTILKEMLPAALESALGKTLSQLIVKSVVVASYLSRMTSTYSNLVGKIENPVLRNAVNTGVFVGVTSAIFNTYKLSQHQISCQDAISNTIEDSGVAFGSTYIAEGIIQQIGNGKYTLTALMDESAQISIIQSATGAFLHYGVVTFIFDETQSLWKFTKGYLTTEEFIAESGASTIKSLSAGTASYCAILLGNIENPFSFVPLIVSIGTYLLVSKGINKYKEYKNRDYLFIEDIYPFLPLSLQRQKSIWESSVGISLWDETVGDNKNNLWNIDKNHRETLWEFHGDTIWK